MGNSDAQISPAAPEASDSDAVGCFRESLAERLRLNAEPTAAHSVSDDLHIVRRGAQPAVYSPPNAG